MDRIESKIIGEEVRRIREKKGWSQPHLAKRMVRPQCATSIYRIENGEYNLRIDIIAEVAGALNTTPAWLIRNVPPRKRVGKQVRKSARKLPRRKVKQDTHAVASEENTVAAE